MDLYAPIARNLVAPLWAWKDGSPHFGYLRELEKTQYWRQEKIRKLQWKLLKRMIDYAYGRVSFYKERLDSLGIKPEQIRSFDDYLQVPFLTKRDIQDRVQDLLATEFPKKNLVRNTTGGSTGSPLVFYLDQERMASRLASTLRHNRWAGWQTGHKVGVLWGARQDLTPFKSLKARLRNALLDRRLTLDTSSIDENKLSEFARDLKRFKPKIILAYANSAYLFAGFVAANQITGIRPEAVVTSAEVLHPHERQAIESVFGCPVFNRYGCRETSIIASECDRHSGLHLNAETLYVEIVKDGKPAQPGQTGEVVVTDLLNLAMPLLRYKVEDAASWAESDCPCGRNLPRLKEVSGRVTDFIVTPEGKLVSGASLTIYLITDIPGIRQVQIIQDTQRHLWFKLVRDGAFTEESMRKFDKKIRQFLGNSLSLDFEFVTEIPREPSGKYRFSISRVASELFK
jgi:phenylacetate-CoA ligase